MILCIWKYARTNENFKVSAAGSLDMMAARFIASMMMHINVEKDVSIDKSKEVCPHLTLEFDLATYDGKSGQKKTGQDEGKCYLENDTGSGEVPQLGLCDASAEEHLEVLIRKVTIV